MGCMSRREFEVRPEQKWDYISLNDFKSSSCWQPFAYGYLWFSLILSTAVYAVDTFTAVNLLAFNKWSGGIKPSQIIPFDVSKWIFSICIILSFINLAFEHIRARRVMNRGSVAECYLDNLAARLESVRMGSGRGWRRFLVFAELTRSKKGAEYLALFTYFSFQSWIRVLVCSGPRQVVNALTLYSIYNARLQINGDTFESSLLNFFSKIKALATEDFRQALILSGMIFTLVVWMFSFLFLAAGALCFVFFLWHYIPRADGGLSGYCERKANKRLMQIVSKKINKAMAEDERRRKKAEFKAAKKNGGDRPVSMKATLPNVELATDNKLSATPTLHRNETMTTLPPYSSRPGTPSAIELNSMDQRRPMPPMPSRSATAASAATSVSQFSSHQPLLGAAAGLGITRITSPAPSLPPLDMNFQPPPRTGTAASNRGYAGPPQPMRSPVNASNGYRGAGFTGVGRPAGDEYSNGPASPASSMSSYRRGPLSPPGSGPNGYPTRSATSPMPSRAPEPFLPPQRNMTGPLPPSYQSRDGGTSPRNMRAPPPQYRPTQDRGDYFGRLDGNRPGTANSQRPTAPQGGYDSRAMGTDGDRRRRY